MGATKKMLMEEADLDLEIDVVHFLRANGVGFVECEYDCIIFVVSDFAQGDLHISQSITRRQAVSLLRGLGIPVPNEFAG